MKSGSGRCFWPTWRRKDDIIERALCLMGGNIRKENGTQVDRGTRFCCPYELERGRDYTFSQKRSHFEWRICGMTFYSDTPGAWISRQVEQLPAGAELHTPFW